MEVIAMPRQSQRVLPLLRSSLLSLFSFMFWKPASQPKTGRSKQLELASKRECRQVGHKMGVVLAGRQLADVVA